MDIFITIGGQRVSFMTKRVVDEAVVKKPYVFVSGEWKTRISVKHEKPNWSNRYSGKP